MYTYLLFDDDLERRYFVFLCQFELDRLRLVHVDAFQTVLKFLRIESEKDLVLLLADALTLVLGEHVAGR